MQYMEYVQKEWSHKQFYQYALLNKANLKCL